jgi:hypothetical protein
VVWDVTDAVPQVFDDLARGRIPAPIASHLQLPAKRRQPPDLPDHLVNMPKDKPMPRGLPLGQFLNYHPGQPQDLPLRESFHWYLPKWRPPAILFLAFADGRRCVRASDPARHPAGTAPAGYSLIAV